MTRRWYGSHWDSRSGVLVRVQDYDDRREEEGVHGPISHGAGCQCDECMADDPAFAEEAHYRTYTPSVPEDAPEEDR